MAVLLCFLLLSSCSTSDDVANVPVAPNNAAVDSIEIGFSNYVGRNTTRGTVQNETTLKSSDNGVGVFAMYTKKGDSETDENAGQYGSTDHASFSDNLMQNVHLIYNSNSSAWTYSPRRYWPNNSTEYVSFLAYAPYQTTSPLVDLNGNASQTTSTDVTVGDATYIKYTLTDNNPESTTDWMYNSNNALNQQCYMGETGDDLHTTDYAIMDADGNSTVQNDLDADKNYAVKLKMSHATARLAFAITSSALADSHNFLSTYKEGKESEATITINKFIIGKRSEDKDPAMPRRKFASTTVTNGSDIEGAFYGGGYLNLNPTATERWAGFDEANLVKFSFNGTDNPTYTGTLSASTEDGDKWSPDSKDDANKQIVLTATREATSGNGTVNAIGNSASDYMFIIPQNFEGSTTAKTTGVTDQESGDGPTVVNPKALTCYINYTVTYATNGETTVENDDDKLKVTYYAYGEIGKDFKVGKAYLILVDIGAGTSFAPIKINVTQVNDWTDDSEQQIN